MICRLLLFVLYYTILYYTNTNTILYYPVLSYAILYYTILYYAILYYTILYYTILYYTVLYCTISYYTILYHIVIYYTKYTLYHLYIYIYMYGCGLLEPWGSLVLAVEPGLETSAGPSPSFRRQGGQSKTVCGFSLSLSLFWGGGVGG